MFKLFRKRSLWLPTWPTLLIAATALVVGAWVFVANIHPYLSVTERAAGASILVVEGWVPDSTLETHLKDFKPGEPYNYICTTGSTLPRGHYLSEFKTFADLTAKTLEQLGVPRDRIIIAPSESKNKDRTYYSALAFKEKFEASQIPAVKNADAIDVLTRDIHGRRTRTIFRKLLGDEVEIGIISDDPGNYEPSRWYASTEGAKAVFTETISLAYEWFWRKGR